jgi:hypothetical protein
MREVKLPGFLFDQLQRRSRDGSQRTQSRKGWGVMNERKEPPFLIEIGTAVEVNNSGRAIRATSINVRGCGVLLKFQELDPFLVGDPVFCDFNIADQTQNPLPHLA